MANLTYDNRVNRSIVAEMRDNQNRLVVAMDIMYYRVITRHLIWEHEMV